MLLKKIRSIINENYLLSAIVIVYVLIGFLLQDFLEVDNMMHVELASKKIFVFALIVSIGILLIKCISRSLGKYLNTVSIAGFAIILLLLSIFESTFASIKQAIPIIHDFSFDRFLMNLDYYFHLGHHPYHFFSFVWKYEGLLRATDRMYMLWFVVLFTFCFWMGWTSERQLRLRFFLTAFFIWAGLGSLLGTLFSSAGPCYYVQVVSEGESPYKLLMSNLYRLHEVSPLLAVQNQIGLWDAKLANQWLPFGGISAMPSIHVAMAVLFALVAWQRNRVLGIVFTAYALWIQVGSVILGWHYAVDGYVAAVLTVILWNYIPRFFLVARQIDTFESGKEHKSKVTN